MAETDAQSSACCATPEQAAAKPEATFGLSDTVVANAVGPLAGHRICIDPGHDGYWVVGASGYSGAGVVPRHPVDGVPLYEHELSLSVAVRLEALLVVDGAAVCLTRKHREEGGTLVVTPHDFTGDGRVRTAGQAIEDEPERSQPRIDAANGFGAEVLLSIHFNGAGDRSIRGTETYYSDTGDRAEEDRRLAAGVQASLLSEMTAAGYPGLDRGIKSDRYERYSPEEMRRLLANNAAILRAHGQDAANCRDCYRLFTLGNNPMSLDPGRYAGALVEVEFLSNPAVVEGFIMRPDSFDIVARGLAIGLRQYFGAE
jgi:N-acetylmuramoyl-L-alanine amidase